MSKSLPDHLFVDMRGDLYDTRTSDWHKNAPLRAGYAGHSQSIDNVAKLKAALREGSATGVGGYLVYFITSDGAALSFDSVTKNLRSVFDSVKNQINDGWRVVALDVNYEDADLVCEHSGHSIECAYN